MSSIDFDLAVFTDALEKPWFVDQKHQSAPEPAPSGSGGDET